MKFPNNLEVKPLSKKTRISTILGFVTAVGLASLSITTRVEAVQTIPVQDAIERSIVYGDSHRYLLDRLDPNPYSKKFPAPETDVDLIFEMIQFSETNREATRLLCRMVERDRSAAARVDQLLRKKFPKKTRQDGQPVYWHDPYFKLIAAQSTAVAHYEFALAILTIDEQLIFGGNLQRFAVVAKAIPHHRIWEGDLHRRLKKEAIIARGTNPFLRGFVNYHLYGSEAGEKDGMASLLKALRSEVDEIRTQAKEALQYVEFETNHWPLILQRFQSEDFGDLLEIIGPLSRAVRFHARIKSMATKEKGQIQANAIRCLIELGYNDHWTRYQVGRIFEATDDQMVADAAALYFQYFATEHASIGRVARQGLRRPAHEAHLVASIRILTRSRIWDDEIMERIRNHLAKDSEASAAAIDYCRALKIKPTHDGNLVAAKLKLEPNLRFKDFQARYPFRSVCRYFEQFKADSLPFLEPLLKHDDERIRQRVACLILRFQNNHRGSLEVLEKIMTQPDPVFHRQDLAQRFQVRYEDAIRTYLNYQTDRKRRIEIMFPLAMKEISGPYFAYDRRHAAKAFDDPRFDLSEKKDEIVKAAKGAIYFDDRKEQCVRWCRQMKFDKVTIDEIIQDQTKIRFKPSANSVKTLAVHHPERALDFIENTLKNKSTGIASHDRFSYALEHQYDCAPLSKIGMAARATIYMPSEKAKSLTHPLRSVIDFPNHQEPDKIACKAALLHIDPANKQYQESFLAHASAPMVGDQRIFLLMCIELKADATFALPIVQQFRFHYLPATRKLALKAIEVIENAKPYSDP